MDDSDFHKNKPQRCKNGIKNEKNEEETIYFVDHIRTWSVISKKKISLFFNQSAARGFNSCSKTGPSCEKLAHFCAPACIKIKSTMADQG